MRSKKSVDIQKSKDKKDASEAKSKETPKFEKGRVMFSFGEKNVNLR